VVPEVAEMEDITPEMETDKMAKPTPGAEAEVPAMAPSGAMAALVLLFFGTNKFPSSKTNQTSLP